MKIRTRVFGWDGWKGVVGKGSDRGAVNGYNHLHHQKSHNFSFCSGVPGLSNPNAYSKSAVAIA